jgi:hypothetical protein
VEKGATAHPLVARAIAPIPKGALTERPWVGRKTTLAVGSASADMKPKMAKPAASDLDVNVRTLPMAVARQAGLRYVVAPMRGRDA